MTSAVARSFGLFIALAIAPANAADNQVRVTGGQVEGITASDGIRVFKGIPFAAPPVGELRWKGPQPVVPWEGVLKADKFGPPSMQTKLAEFIYRIKPSEDSLHLNIWTAAQGAGERRPVMVWIYGGAFNGGYSGDPLFDGTSFAKKGVILVTFNYRLGIFGFLAHPELSAESGKGSGCYGIQDQVAALRWVRENIAQFGGDPANVTIFGQSAGGASVSILAQSPLAKGLFHRAICQSGCSMDMIKPAADQPGGLVASLTFAEERGKEYLVSVGAADIKAARALSADELMKGNAGLPWPVADGETIVGDPFELYESGRFNDTPVLAGCTSNDGGFLGSPDRSPEEFEQAIRKDFAEAADAILDVYPHATSAEASRSSRDLLRDAFFGWQTWALARLQTERGQGKAFLYYFDEPKDEANHGREVQYVFGAPPKSGIPFFKSVSEQDQELSRVMVEYWTNFAKTGDPNGAGLPEWTPFVADDQKAMVFNYAPSMQTIPNLPQIDAIDALFRRRREASSER